MHGLGCTDQTIIPSLLLTSLTQAHTVSQYAIQFQLAVTKMVIQQQRTQKTSPDHRKWATL